MSEKRRPTITMLLRFSGKKNNKIELFDAKLFGWKRDSYDCNGHGKYRIKVNGRWNDTQDERYEKYFTLYEFRDLLFRTIIKRK